MTRVFARDDYDVVRRSRKELPEARGDIEVIGEAGTAVQARSGIPLAEPGVAVLDVRLAGGSGVDVCREIRSQPEIKCVMFARSMMSWRSPTQCWRARPA
jgi:two-component system, NarL family, response regulator DevR